MGRLTFTYIGFRCNLWGVSSPDVSGDLRELSSDLVVHAARLVRAVRRNIEQPASVRILSLLDEYGALGVSQLAVADRSSQPTTSGAVTGLVERGWADKQPNPADARGSLVSLTEAGREELRRVRRMNGELVASRFAEHGHHNLEDLATAVAVLRDVLATEPTAARPRTTEKGTL